MQNKMEIKLELNEFVKSNMMQINSDIECEFMVDAQTGIQGQLYKLNNSNEYNWMEALNILLGKAACIGEEWNYHQLDADSWTNIFNPKNDFPPHILKTFEKTPIEKFLLKLKEFKSHVIEKTNPSPQDKGRFQQTVYKPFKFNGQNVSEIYNEENILPPEEIQNLFSFDQIEILNCFSNSKKWNWQFWFIETKKEYFLFEEYIVS